MTGPGMRIDRYEVLGVLGHGAMGVLYKARDPQLERIVAIKTVRPDRTLLAGQPADMQTLLLQEATAVARLSHPAIIAVHDVVAAADVPCIVMEYFEGRTLAELIAAGSLPVHRAVRIVLDIAQALAYAHAHGVVHRDIKSTNILVAPSGAAKLGDFGVARLVDKQTTQTGFMVGTPAYMAPEQLKGQRADARSDLFSLGVVLYEAVTGQPPFAGEDLGAVLYQIVHVEPVPARERSGEVSPSLDAVIRRVLRKDPVDRYPDAQAFADALAEAVDAGAPTGGRRRLLEAGRKHRRALSMATAGLLVTVVSALALMPSPADRGNGSPTPVTLNEPSRVEPAAAESPAATPLESGAEPLRVAAVEPSPAEPAPPRLNPQPEKAVARLAAVGESAGCVSVNAVPFASVYVDGQHVGDTPKACLRIGVGEHRLQFRSAEDRSPERVLQVTDGHTIEHPLRLGYDFGSREFVE